MPSLLAPQALDPAGAAHNPSSKEFPRPASRPPRGRGETAAPNSSVSRVLRSAAAARSLAVPASPFAVS